MEAKLVQDLRAHLPTTNRLAVAVSTRSRYAWIDEDPDLAPRPRRETPLSAWC